MHSEGDVHGKEGGMCGKEGMHGKSGGVRGGGGLHGEGGACMAKGGRCVWYARPLFYKIRPVNARAVRILLECILVSKYSQTCN